MSQRRSAPYGMTTNLYLRPIINRSSCRRHSAEEGVPCFTIYRGLNPPAIGICNRRAISAGVNRPIRPESLRLSRPERPSTVRPNKARKPWKERRTA